MSYFTEEERKYIDSQLILADEMQRKNGNKLTPFEEFMDELLEDIRIGEESYRV